MTMVFSTNSTTSFPKCISILRIGGLLGNQVAVDIIQKQLLRHFGNSNAHQNSCMLYFSNKYFSAHVQLKSTSSSLNAAGDAQENENENNNDIELHHKEDGIILIFPNDAAIESLTFLHDEIMSSNIPELGDTLRLCLTTTTSKVNNNTTLTVKQKEEQYSQRVLWCLDHGYEYIEVDISDVGLTTGFDQREKDGFARVIEAIQGTVWSSAIMGGGGGEAPTRKSSNNLDQDKEQSSLQGMKKKDDDIEITSNIHINDANNDIRQSSIMEKGEGEEKALEKEINKSVDNNDSGDKNEKKEEILTNEIDKVMKEATRIREQSKSGQLSDNDRRQRAGDAATMLMGLLDQIGFDDDDSCCSSDEE